MLGWALSAQWCEDASFLDPAERAAAWWIEHVPPDRVAFWDFDDPAIPNTHRDTSATAIAAAASSSSRRSRATSAIAARGALRPRRRCAH